MKVVKHNFWGLTNNTAHAEDDCKLVHDGFLVVGVDDFKNQLSMCQWQDI